MLTCKKVALAAGLWYIAAMHFAPQETRTYMVTTVTVQRRRLFRVTPTAELLERTILDYRDQGRFLLHAYVIMPDHLHTLITPASDVSLEKAMQFIKGGFSFRLKSKLDVWERSFNESQISTEEKFMSCMRYIHENPVRRGLVATAQEYRFSSIARALDPMPVHLREDKARAPSVRNPMKGILLFRASQERLWEP